MANNSPIEWTDATWNPIVGCSIVSPGCTNCYAMKMAARIEAMGNQPRYAGTTKKVNGNAVWTGKLAQAPDSVLLAPLKRKKPTTYFVNSMGDLFHEDCPDEWIDRVFAVMALSPQHTFQVLTKRAERMREYLTTADDEKLGLPTGEGERRDHICVEAFNINDVLSEGKVENAFTDNECFVNPERWPLPNVWLGVSTERQQEADERIPHLLETPAAVRFISAEPLLGPIDLQTPGYTGFAGDGGPHGNPYLDWVIVGGESGPNARPMHPAWARDLRDQCKAAGVPFFFKQWGAWAPHKVEPGADLGSDVRRGTVRIVHPSGRSEVEVFEASGGRNTEPGSRYMRLAGKKSAGRHLDGALHDAMPQRRSI